MVAVFAARILIGRYLRYSVTKFSAAERQRQSGSVYVVRLQARPGADGIRALRATLKALWRFHRVRCLDVREVCGEKRQPSGSSGIWLDHRT